MAEKVQTRGCNPTRCKCQSARFEMGNSIENLTSKLFPDGHKIPFDAHDFKNMGRLTQTYLDEGVENIYEATFIYEGIVVMVILRQTPEGLEIYEVKMKPIYLHDVYIQLYVLRALGFIVISNSKQ